MHTCSMLCILFVLLWSYLIFLISVVYYGIHIFKILLFQVYNSSPRNLFALDVCPCFFPVYLIWYRFISRPLFLASGSLILFLFLAINTKLLAYIFGWSFDYCSSNPRSGLRHNVYGLQPSNSKWITCHKYSQLWSIVSAPKLNSPVSALIPVSFKFEIVYEVLYELVYYIMQKFGHMYFYSTFFRYLII